MASKIKTTQQKYDWDRLKLEFLVSPIADLSERWRHKRGTDEAPKNGNFKKQTSGWVEEKQKLKDELLQKALEELKKEGVELYKPSLRSLGEMHEAIITLARAKLRIMQGGNVDKVSDVNMQDLIKLWEMVKIEKGEPTRYVDQKTTIKEESHQELTPEEEEKIKQLQSL